MSYLYTGTYTEPPLGRNTGIVVYRYDDDSGAIEHIQTVDGLTNPTFLATSADERFVYAVCESQGGAVAAFSRDAATGLLTELNRQSSGGDGPCHVSVDLSGGYALVANYGSGSVAALPINEDGSLGEPSSVVQHEGSSVNPDRQEGPHAHMIVPSPDGRFVLANDLGTDEVVTYTLDTESGQLERRSAMKTHPGAGPRHLAFSPDGRSVYVINELDSTLTACDYNPETGALTARETITALPEGYDGESYCAHVVVSEDGRFVYGSNRGHDSIVVWAVDQQTGELSVAGHTSTEGSFPRNFTLDRNGSRLLVANQNSDNLAILRRNREDGLLTLQEVLGDIPSTVALVFCDE
ncbi:MAG TPA: lactonase family protein [Thermomicrobiales bacterium]|nr:lactonase family protein [Thermomicrobiales bacterium]